MNLYELEDAIIAYKPNAAEVCDLLHALVAALRNEYDEPSDDVFYYCKRFEDAICKFAEEANPYEPDPMTLAKDRDLERDEEAVLGSDNKGA